MSSDSKLDLFNDIYSSGSTKISDGSKSGDYGGCPNSGTYFWPKIILSKNAVWEGALLRCKIYSSGQILSLFSINALP
jgi:hypothetical protein